ncbi:MAG TPA: translocation/assembly module TamB domain-containing protein [Burkholderiaceae bacterium]|nr:translocation/assembly module TamB domain-containing protein [Burkholderiaceae bacterium]
MKREPEAELAPAHSPGAAGAPKRRRGRWIVLGTLLVLLLLAVVALPGWLLGTTSGLVTIVQVVTSLTGVRIDLTTPRGSVINGFGAERVRVVAGRTEVEIDNLGATLTSFGLRPLRFDFDGLDATRVDVRVRPSPTPPKAEDATDAPRSIASPVAVSAQQLRVGEFRLRVGRDESPTTLGARRIDGRLALGPSGYRIENGNFEFGPLDAPLQASVKGSLAGAAPFSIDASGSLASTVQEKRVQAQLTAGGSLIDLRVDAQVESGGAGGHVHAQIASFGPQALKSLDADLAGIDPKVWASGAPQADLRIEAKLTPLPAPPFGLSGPVRVENRAPGAIDAGRIPARRASAHVTWREKRIAARDIEAQLVRGNVRGIFQIQLGAAAEWETEARFDGVDPATLYTRLQSLTIDGNARARHSDGASFVEATLRNRGKLPATLVVDLRADPERVLLNSGQLQLGSGVLDARGEIGLTGRQPVHLEGSARAFDPALLVRGVEARLNGTFTVDGTLTPRAGTATLDLTDSMAFDRPLAGRATVRLAGQLLDVDADLAIRNARLVARGGLGDATRTLAIELNAPALDVLLPQLRGAAQAKAQLRGSWQQPAVEADVSATELRYAGHAVSSLSLHGTYAGGSDGAFDVRAAVDGHRYGSNTMASLRTAALTLTGKPSQHTLHIAALNAENQPLQAQASGGYAGGRWRGSLDTATVGRPLDLLLLAAAPIDIQVETRTLRAGPARLQVAGAQVEDLLLEVDDRGIATRGEFSNFQPTELEPWRAVPRAIQLRPQTARDPLTLRGTWQLRLGQVADGRIVIERSGGDLYAGAAGDTAMGVNELRAALQVRANALETEAILRGQQLGALVGRMTAYVERDAEAGWRLAQKRPWNVRADADLPSISWVNRFLSDRVRATVRLRGQLNAHLRIEGTPAQPRAEGTVTGDKLRVSWIDQAVRLDNGVLRARVEGDTILLDELRFTGAPRVQPALKRAAEAVGNVEGFAVASGRLKLPDLAGYLQVQASKLPLVQRTDRWVIATGGANIEFSPKRVQLNGAVTADAGYVDFSRPELPSLSSDVVVRESTTQPGPREPRVAVGFDLGIALGDAFFLRGSGLDTRVAGAVRLRTSAQGAVRATGSVTAEEGIFEGYGQKLRITRGRVNFQGVPENPGLDILALRTDLPAEAGEIGVSITRTAANPLIRLYSDPPLADFQALSWLVLGRPAEQSGADNIALARAAVGLLSGAGEGVPTTLARQLGIDEISLRSGTVGGGPSLLPRQSVAGSLRGNTSATASGEIVAIGKRVNDAITISYEQSLTGVGGVVSLAYQLSQRLQLIARAGTEQALDLVYSFSFD